MKKHTYSKRQRELAAQFCDAMASWWASDRTSLNPCANWDDLQAYYLVARLDAIVWFSLYYTQRQRKDAPSLLAVRAWAETAAWLRSWQKDLPW